MNEVPLGKWISLLYRYGQIYINKELAPYGIGKGQFLFLMVLFKNDGFLQDELAQYLKIDKGTTARAISKLEKNGYVQRVPNPKDLRSNYIYLTRRAEDIKPVICSIINKWTNILSSGMTAEEKEKAFELLTRMAQNATDYIQKERL